MRNPCTKTIKKNRWAKALSFTELLLVIGSVGVVTSVSYVTVTSIQQDTRNTKLLSDVRRLNSAVATYLASGGHSTELSDAESVLYKLKQSVTESERLVYAGAGTGSLIDLRITFSEIKSTGSGLCAYWDAEAMIFKVTNKPVAGMIKGFKLCNKAGSVDYGNDESRAPSALTYSRESDWIWDYIEKKPETGAIPSSFPIKSGNGSDEPVLKKWDDDDPPGTGGTKTVGGIALNVGSGNATASEGLALNVLSDDVSAGKGQLAAGVVGIKITLGGDGSSEPEIITIGNFTADDSGSGLIASLGKGNAKTQDGIAANVGEGSATSKEGIAANVGEGSSSAKEGIAANVGEGQSTAQEGIAGNVGSGSSSATKGIGLNLGSGNATAGGQVEDD